MAAALTRRERKVKQLLLRELTRMSNCGALSYAEIQHLDKTLSVDFIDRELAKMQKHMRWTRWAMVAGLVVAAGAGVASLVSLLVFGAAFEWMTHLYLPVWLGTMAIGQRVQLRSLRRKQFIYEALRELSDADEIDVTLGRVAREADALIERIVQQDLDFERTLAPRSAAISRN